MAAGRTSLDRAAAPARGPPTGLPEPGPPPEPGPRYPSCIETKRAVMRSMVWMWFTNQVGTTWVT